MKAVCQRCGADKPGPLVPCRDCTHVPLGEERTVAWLLSDHHLSPSELETAARRVRKGERLAPPEQLLQRARENLERAVPGRRRRPKTAKPPATAPAATPTPGAPATGDTPTADPRARGTPQPTGDARPEAGPAWTTAPSLSSLLALDAEGPPGGALPAWALVTLTGVSIVLTPLPAWFAWWQWRESAPHAARQVRRVALWTSVAFLSLWLGAMVATWGGALP